VLQIKAGRRLAAILSINKQVCGALRLDHHGSHSAVLHGHK